MGRSKSFGVPRGTIETSIWQLSVWFSICAGADERRRSTVGEKSILIYLMQPNERMTVHCCARMDCDLNHKCDIHKDRSDYPDAFIAFVGGGHGLLVHDGGSSVIKIRYCPWCGSKLPRTGDLKSSA